MIQGILKYTKKPPKHQNMVLYLKRNIPQIYISWVKDMHNSGFHSLICLTLLSWGRFLQQCHVA